jgi:type II secretory pathway pseudopilin PulG
MKNLIQAVVVAAALAAPVAVFAQSNQPNQPVTRAQVRAELIELEQAGYRPGDGDNTNYPEALQAAQAKVAAKHGNTAYGGVANGSSQSGAPVQVLPNDQKSMYSHH